MKRLVLVLLAALLSVSALACARPAAIGLIKSDKQRIANPSVAPADLSSLVSGNNGFALELYQQLKGEGKNLFYSPYSISLMLAMTYAGAHGANAQQMAEAMNFALAQERLHAAFNYLEQELARRGATGAQGFRLDVVNDLWGQKDYQFLAPFLDVLAENYGAGLRILDFVKDPEGARQTINDYIADKTQQLIKDLIPSGSINGLTRLVLTNAIYFKAEWENKFNKEETRPGSFTLLDGSQVTASLMNQRRNWSYAEGAGYQAIELPYLGGQIAMDILLPQADKFNEFEDSLTAARLADILGQLKPDDVLLTLPKFKFGADFSLKGALSTLGMPLAFDPFNADFSGITTVEDLYIQDAIHKAYVAVDEAGTEAAAAGAVIVGTVSIPKTFIADHPFIFFIRDLPTNTILFVGRVMNPAA